MKTFESVAQAREWCAEVRARGQTLGLVPTMGALHAGHVELVARSIAENERTCVSVFVNPLQFDDPADLARYPRDFAGDVELLREVGCSMVFTGRPVEFFGEGHEQAASNGMLLDPGPVAEGLEGAERPGHFAGVATVVERLFDIVRPTRAYFGRKDYQQCLVVQALACARGGPSIVTCPTVREPSGLALSSRNLRLDEREREQALALSQALRAAREAWQAGEREAERLAQALRQSLARRAGIHVEYAEIRDPEHWQAEPPSGALERAVALLAVRVGPVRLIDNLRLDDPGDPTPGADSSVSSVERSS